MAVTGDHRIPRNGVSLNHSVKQFPGIFDVSDSEEFLDLLVALKEMICSSSKS